MIAFIIRLFGYEFSVTFGKYERDTELNDFLSNTGGSFDPALGDEDEDIEEVSGGFGFRA